MVMMMLMEKPTPPDHVPVDHADFDAQMRRLIAAWAATVAAERVKP